MKIIQPGLELAQGVREYLQLLLSSTVIHRTRVKGIAAMIGSLHELIRPSVCSAFTPDLYRDKLALEIGDVSSVFERDGMFPVYPLLKQLNRIMVSETTPWTHLRHSATPAGTVYIGCATVCNTVPGTYDLILASHVLEHIANPLKALLAWKRLLNDNGRLVLILPLYTHTHDHRRARTTFSHLDGDLRCHTTEDDLTHVEDFLRLYDHKMVTRTPAEDGDLCDLAARNMQTRIVHHHTWDMTLLKLALGRAGYRVEQSGYHPPFHLVAVAGRERP